MTQRSVSRVNRQLPVDEDGRRLTSEIDRNQYRFFPTIKEIGADTVRCVEGNQKKKESRGVDLLESPEVPEVQGWDGIQDGLSVQTLISTDSTILNTLCDETDSVNYIYAGKEIERSNVVDLLKDCTREYAHGRPQRYQRLEKSDREHR